MEPLRTPMDWMRAARECKGSGSYTANIGGRLVTMSDNPIPIPQGHVGYTLNGKYYITKETKSEADHTKLEADHTQVVNQLREKATASLYKMAKGDMTQENVVQDVTKELLIECTKLYAKQEGVDETVAKQKMQSLQSDIRDVLFRIIQDGVKETETDNEDKEAAQTEAEDDPKTDSENDVNEEDPKTEPENENKHLTKTESEAKEPKSDNDKAKETESSKTESELKTESEAKKNDEVRYREQMNEQINKLLASARAIGMKKEYPLIETLPRDLLFLKAIESICKAEYGGRVPSERSMLKFIFVIGMMGREDLTPNDRITLLLAYNIL